MSGWDKARDAVKMIDVAVKGMEQLQGLTKIGGLKAEAILMAVDVGLASIADGFAGKTSPEIVEADINAAIESLKSSIVSNNAQAADDLDKKFPT